MFTAQTVYKTINVFGQCKLTDSPKSTILKYITFTMIMYVYSTLCVAIVCVIGHVQMYSDIIIIVRI